SMARNTPFPVPLSPCNLGTTETASNLDPDALCALSHSVLNRALHRTTEHNAALQLAGYTCCNKLGVEIRLTNLFDIDVDGNAHQVGDILTQLIDVFAFLTNYDTRTCRVDRNPRILRRALDCDFANR